MYGCASFRVMEFFGVNMNNTSPKTLFDVSVPHKYTTLDLPEFDTFLILPVTVTFPTNRHVILLVIDKATHTQTFYDSSIQWSGTRSGTTARDFDIIRTFLSDASAPIFVEGCQWVIPPKHTALQVELEHGALRFRPDHRQGYCNPVSLLILTLCYLLNTPDVHEIAREVTRLLCDNQSDHERSLTLRRIFQWHESIILATNVDTLSNLLTFSGYTPSTTPIFTKWRTIDPFLGALSQRHKHEAHCVVWFPRHFDGHTCLTPECITDNSHSEWYIAIVPKHQFGDNFWMCLKQDLKASTQHVIVELATTDDEWLASVTREVQGMVPTLCTVAIMKYTTPILLSSPSC